MTRRGIVFFIAFLVGVSAASAGDVVVLKGGERIELAGPWMQQGNNALLTRSDGVLFSIAVGEIDLKATAEARRASRRATAPVPAVAETPREAVRMGRAGAKAKVRLTDADVSHDVAQMAEGSAGEKKDTPKGLARLDVAGYDQAKAGANLIVRGSVRNFGGTAASDARLSISALDESGEVIGTGEASLAKGSLEPFETVAFTAAVPVGEKVVSGLRFKPQWVPAPLPASPAEAAAAAAAATKPGAPGAPAATAPAPNKPAPLPPIGQGVLYAAPAPPASMVPPTDGRTGYIPGASDPASQPKPPQ